MPIAAVRVNLSWQEERVRRFHANKREKISVSHPWSRENIQESLLARLNKNSVVVHCIVDTRIIITGATLESVIPIICAKQLAFENFKYMHIVTHNNSYLKSACPITQVLRVGSYGSGAQRLKYE